MSFESLNHTPVFDLPDYAPPITPDALALIEEYHRGLHKVVVSKQMRRDNYDVIATITCQEAGSGNSKTHPAASPDDIGEYVMLCIQWEIERSDAPGVYRVKLFGAPGKGRFDKSKHIDMRGEGDARDIQVLTEGELTEQQSQYIGELHSQLVAQNEVIMGMVKPLLSENKEMMKILSEAVKNNAEVEAVRNKHAIEMKIHADEMKIREEESEQKMKRWMELLGVVKDTGAPEALFKAVISKLNQSAQEAGEKKRQEKEEEEEQEEAEEEPKKIEAKSGKKKRRKKRSRKKPAEPEAAPPIEEESPDEDGSEAEDAFLREGLEMIDKSPLVLCAQGLKMTIDDNDQWDLAKETLTEEQYNQLIAITESTNDEDLKKKLQSLYKMRGLKRLMKLHDHLDDEQKKFLDKLIEAAVE